MELKKDLVCKYVFVINGKPTSGKTTFEELVLNKLSGQKYSIIDPVKELLFRNNLWDGKSKTPKDRKLLSDIKVALDEYCDFSYQRVKEYIDDFRHDKIHGNVLFVDMREEKDIKRAKEDLNAIVIYIENENVNIEPSNVGDEFASNVNNYPYDYIIDNSSDLESLNGIVDVFVQCIKNAIEKIK